ncbi:MAG: flavodoxin-dependent (E)-4-hydroxy-3-methylbut-2-enyl-diphosphate synthase [Kiritimatiellia bacterium]
MRSQTRQIKIGSVAVGGGAPVSVQTMANVPTTDVANVLSQIDRAADLGCDLFRVAVPDRDAAESLKVLCAKSRLPLIADIHFDYRLALAAIEAGVGALRINPGNIGEKDRVRQVVEAARPRQIPIRIGVNGGSLEKSILARYGSATAEALVESALGHVRLLESLDYYEIKISVKASDIPRTLAAYRLLASKVNYPLHLGLTEAGTFLHGTVTSCVALSALLNEGIGDTLRISLTAPIEEEVRVGVELLRACGLRTSGAWVTSCPTCGRTQVNVQAAAETVTDALELFYRRHPSAKRLHVAVMGCVVNGPGEAREADVALCGGRGTFTLYHHGKQLVTLPEAVALDALLRVVREDTAVSY